MKYKLGDKHEKIELYRIIAIRSFKGVSAGSIGGWIESEKNLSQTGDAWVFGNAWVSGDAQVSGNALVSGNARVYGNAWVFGNAQVYGNALVYGDAQVSGNALVSGNAQVYGNAQVFGNARVSGNARVYGNAPVYGDAWVSGNARVYGNLAIDYTPINIIGLKYSITIFKKSGYLQAGCHLKTTAEWKTITSFEDQEFLDEWKDKILAFAK